MHQRRQCIDPVLGRGSVNRDAVAGPGVGSVPTLQGMRRLCGAACLGRFRERVEGGSLEKVRDKIKEIVNRQKFDSLYYKWRTGLREDAYIEIKL